MNSLNNLKNKQFKKAVIDQILLWIVLFTSFVTIFLMVIDYYQVIKAKDKSDSLSSYGSRMQALGKDTDEIITGLNNIKGTYFSIIYDDNLTCNTLSTSRYQVIFNTNITFKNMFLSDGETIGSTSVAFNEINSTDQNCTLNLSVSE